MVKGVGFFIREFREIKEFRELNTNLPKFSKFSNLFITFVKKDGL